MIPGWSRWIPRPQLQQHMLCANEREREAKRKRLGIGSVRPSTMPVPGVASMVPNSEAAP